VTFDDGLDMSEAFCAVPVESVLEEGRGRLYLVPHDIRTLSGWKRGGAVRANRQRVICGNKTEVYWDAGATNLPEAAAGGGGKGELVGPQVLLS